jgi:hypothetical protein
MSTRRASSDNGCSASAPWSINFKARATTASPRRQMPSSGDNSGRQRRHGRKPAASAAAALAKYVTRFAHGAGQTGRQ